MLLVKTLNDLTRYPRLRRDVKEPCTAQHLVVTTSEGPLRTPRGQKRTRRKEKERKKGTGAQQVEQRQGRRSLISPSPAIMSVPKFQVDKAQRSWRRKAGREQRFCLRFQNFFFCDLHCAPPAIMGQSAGRTSFPDAQSPSLPPERAQNPPPAATCKVQASSAPPRGRLRQWTNPIFLGNPL